MLTGVHDEPRAPPGASGDRRDASSSVQQTAPVEIVEEYVDVTLRSLVLDPERFDKPLNQSFTRSAARKLLP